MLSVVMCTHNPDEVRLARAIASVRAQETPPGGHEFLIVDNRSDRLLSCDSIVMTSGARVVREERLGLTAARERAAAEVAGDVIVFVDDDNVLGTDYLRTVHELMSDSDIAMLSGQVEPEYEVPPPPWFFAFEEYHAVRRYASDELLLTSEPALGPLLPVGAGAVVRTAILRDYVAASAGVPRIEGRRGAELSAGEDYDIALFAISRGLRVGVCRRLRVLHLIPERRTTYPYMVRMMRGSVASMRLLEEKWAPVFRTSLAPWLVQPRWRLLLKAAAFAALSVSPGWRLRLNVQLALLSFTRSA